jgi:hypothetical protein
VTGFGFPFERLLPSHYTGFISLAVLAIAILARYSFHMAGAWRWIYVITTVPLALWLNVSWDRAAVPEGFLPAAPGADPVRAAVPDRADAGVAGVRVSDLISASAGFIRSRL